MDELELEQPQEDTGKQAAVMAEAVVNPLQDILPVKGMAVHYVRDDYPDQQAGEHIRADVDAVFEDGVVSLSVVNPGPNGLEVFTVSGCSHDENKNLGTWHFIE